MMEILKKPHPVVSIIMVNFNGGELIIQSVRRCFASDIAVEVRIGDNGSSDGSVLRLQQLAMEFNQLFLTRHGTNLGFATACNKAIAESLGKYILLLNPDCLITADSLGKMIESMENHPEAGMAGCRIVDPEGSEQRGCRRTLPSMKSGLATALSQQSHGINQHQQPLPEDPVYVEAISGAFMLVTRDALEQVGPLDEGYFLHCEDLDWCRQFADAGLKILFNPDVEVIHHQGTCSVSRPIRVEWHKHRGMLRYYRKFLAAQTNAFMSAVVWFGVWTRFSLVALKSLLK